MACIATVKGYSDPHNWSNQPNQASEPVQLEDVYKRQKKCLAVAERENEEVRRLTSDEERRKGQHEQGTADV